MLRLALASLAVALAARASDQSSPVTFTKNVLPILQKNCQSCHRPGQVAPMSLISYKDTRPWAKAIKTAVATKKMPPWFADPKYGHFENDRATDGHSRIERIGHFFRLSGADTFKPEQSCITCIVKIRHVL